MLGYVAVLGAKSEEISASTSSLNSIFYNSNEWSANHVRTRVPKVRESGSNTAAPVHDKVRGTA